MKSYATFKKEMLKKQEVKQAYNELGPEFVLVQKLIQKRLAQGLTQEELAERIGTKQSAISRLERGKYNPSLAFLHKVAHGLDAKIQIKIV